jgi:hypothetical protein
VSTTPHKIKANAFLKYKALKLVLPQHANSFGIPSEAPTFISPYITSARKCRECGKTYQPLMYQVGSTTAAHHTCKKGGGGIYVRLTSDTSRKWIYTNDLWDCLVHPHDPIRMGDDNGYQFGSVTPYKFVQPVCHWCNQPTTQGSLVTNGMDYDGSAIVAACGECKLYGTHYNHYAGWTFSYDGTEIHFHPTTDQALTPEHERSSVSTAPLSYEAFMERTNMHRKDQQIP